MPFTPQTDLGTGADLPPALLISAWGLGMPDNIIDSVRSRLGPPGRGAKAEDRSREPVPLEASSFAVRDEPSERSSAGASSWPQDRIILLVLVLVSAGLLAFTWYRSSAASGDPFVVAVGDDGRSDSDDVTDSGDVTGPLVPPTADASAAARDGTRVDMSVHVAGAVVSSGVYALAAGARGIDALGAAGGALDDADLARINLAAPLVDGQQLYVPRVGEAVPAAVAPVGGSAGGTPELLVDINTAGIEELDKLPGVGESTARKIIAHREANGPFKSPQDLLAVSGIGEAKFAEIEGRVRV